MIMRKLDQLEDTINSLIGYLLYAPTNHAKQILGEPAVYVDQTPPARKIRLTQHYTAALLAYGFPAAERELQWAAEWFASPFTGSSVVDELEMTRLEGLLNLRPDDSGVTARLKQLLRQRSGTHFEIERDETQGNRDHVFDTLWALKLILLARDRGVLRRAISDREIGKMLSSVIPHCSWDKDMALALRLVYQHSNHLDNEHQETLVELARRSTEYGSLWGIDSTHRWERIKPLVEAMQRGHLSPYLVEKQVNLFRNIVLNTCYVIENLAPMAQVNEEVEQALQSSMALWWHQFQGEKAPVVLRAFFQEEYDYLLILCRTIVAVNAFVGVPLAAQSWQKPLREMAKQRFGSDKAAELSDLRHALRQWIGIELDRERVDELKLGLSEANVVRIHPRLFDPTDDKGKNLLTTESLIVKSGPIDAIEKERLHFRQIPQAVRHCFVRVPDQTAYVKRRQRAFVIMEDLNEFYTLYEVFETLLKPNRPRLIPALGDFLLTMHRGDGKGHGIASNNHLREMYTLPMLQHLEFIANQVQKSRNLVNGRFGAFDELEQKLDDLLGDIMRQQRKLERFPLALMHGDLHSRNIMIRIVQNEGVSRSDADLQFRLIDLENMRLDGDAAHDAGQLLVDLTLMPTNVRGASLHRSVLEKLETMRGSLERNYLEFARERHDDSFPIRLELARARAYIRIAKGRTKRSVASHRERELQQAAGELIVVTNLVESAGYHLENVAKMIGAT
ncbi:MAG: phosphotransferase [Anaerolineae bacterium]|nr:phosphotransferase [Anaerolineae bacterium]